MSKKSLAFGLCFLLMCSAFIPISLGLNVKVLKIEQSSNIGFGKTLYVGGNGPDNYTKIQDAIDNASDGDTVFVYDDSSPYYESVVVTKSINLIGENNDTTIIDGGKIGDVVEVNSDWVNISGFTIRNSREYWYTAGVYIDSNHVTVSDNVIKNNTMGIIISISHSITIHNNNISNNLLEGIDIHVGTNNNILCNIISNNGDSGIAFRHSSHININGNNISDNYISGITQYDSDYNTISNNTILNSLLFGLYLNSSQNNLIIDNTITNTSTGIFLYDSSENNIIDNPISFKNKGYCIIYLHNSFNNTIKGNLIISNNLVGISLRASNSNTITGNIISYHQYGIRISDSFENLINCNLISNNYYGLALFFLDIYDSKSYSRKNYIQINNFIDNEKHAHFRGYYCSATWYQNYWGRPRLLPKLIFGELKIYNIYIPWINIDWRPALKPYDIEGVV